MCSTPFGIIGILTSPHSEENSQKPCAQRLSASSEFSQQYFPLFSAEQPGAQRLSASSEFSHDVRALHVEQDESAQRLSASSEFSHVRQIHRCDDLFVLNAFRHHRNSHYLFFERRAHCLRCSTPFGIIGILTGDTAVVYLNRKFSAQRLSASSEFSLNARGPQQSELQGAQRLSASSEFSQTYREVRRLNYLCSTPFGIIGILTLVVAKQYNLNPLCSTPFGIIGILTPTNTP